MASEGAGRESPYRVLGLEPRASREQVEKAYRFHLDLYAEGALATSALLDPQEAERQRARVREAYELLRDPDRRRAFDESQGLPPVETPAAHRHPADVIPPLVASPLVASPLVASPL
ncbi:MAG TPA: hypothetical protein VGB87_05080, partial [Vicinamibacteria bacterium]